MASQKVILAPVCLLEFTNLNFSQIIFSTITLFSVQSFILAAVHHIGFGMTSQHHNTVSIINFHDFNIEWGLKLH